MTAVNCPVCDSPLYDGVTCRICAADEDDERRERGAWQAYVVRHKERMGAIARAAEQVCNMRERELLGAQLLGWDDARTAAFLSLDVADVVSLREAAYQKIRAAIGEERIDQMTRRRR